MKIPCDPSQRGLITDEAHRKFDFKEKLWFSYPIVTHDCVNFSWPKRGHKVDTWGTHSLELRQRGEMISRETFDYKIETFRSARAEINHQGALTSSIMTRQRNLHKNLKGEFRELAGWWTKTHVTPCQGPTPMGQKFFCLWHSGIVSCLLIDIP